MIDISDKNIHIYLKKNDYPTDYRNTITIVDDIITTFGGIPFVAVQKQNAYELWTLDSILEYKFPRKLKENIRTIFYIEKVIPKLKEKIKYYD